LKFLPRELGQNVQTLERFRREARSASALNHPNICTIYEISEFEGQSFIAMELLEGQTLRRRLAEGQLKLDLVLDYAMQVADVLDAAHCRNIIHRDIKPENIFLTARGQAKVLDFGLAKLVETNRKIRAGDMDETISSGGDHLTVPGMTLGTVPYMSPEQIRGEELDGRSDLFALGAVLYEMVTGKQAFCGNTTGMIFDAVLNRVPVSISELNTRAPVKLQEIVDKTLEKEPKFRYQSAADLRTDLVRLKRELETGHRSKSSVAVSAAKRREEVRRRRWGLIGLSVVALVALGWVGYRLLHPAPVIAPAALQQIRLTANSTENAVDGSAISPDGRYLAYSDPLGIHIKLIATGDTQTITAPSGSLLEKNSWFPVAWFPDGTRFLANALSEGEASTWVISTLGSRELLRTSAWTQAISPDGSMIAFHPHMNYYGGRELWLMDARGENAHQVLSVGPESGYVRVTWSPHGKKLAYLKQSGSPHGGHHMSLEVVDLQTGAVNVVLSDDRIEDVHWLRDGRLVYSRTHVTPTSDSNTSALLSSDCDLWIVKMDELKGQMTGKPRQLTDWPGFSFSFFTDTADAKHLAFLKFNYESDVYVGEIDAKRTHLTGVHRLTLDDHNDLPTGWMGDSKSVLFFSDRNGYVNVFSQPVVGGSAKALTSGPGYKWAPRMGDDGKWIYYLASKSPPFLNPTSVSLMRIPSEGGAPEVILTGFGIADHRCSQPPVHLCVYDELSEDQRHRTIYTYDAEHGKGRALTTLDPNPHEVWDLSPDGSAIATSSFDPKMGRIRFLSLDGKHRPDVDLKKWKELNTLDWAPDGRGFFVSSTNGRTSTLLYVDMTGNTRVLWQATGSGTSWGIQSPDGRYLAIGGGSFDSNVWTIENF
jgi:serine/threonine protein kinase